MMTPPESVLALFFDFCKRQPTRIAVQDGTECLSYIELEKESYKVAARLSQINISRGDIVPIVTQSSLYMIIGILGALRVGATYVPLDRSQWPLEKIKNTISDLNAKVAIYTGSQVNLGSNLVSVSVEMILRNSEQVENLPLNTCPYKPDDHPSDIMCIIFTSGTTGKPKGVIINHSSVLNFVTSSQFNYDITPNDRVLLVLSCGFDGTNLQNTKC